MPNEQQLDWLKDELSEIRKEIRADNLLIWTELKGLSEFKWKVLGGNTVIHLIVGILVQIAIALFLTKGA